MKKKLATPRKSVFETNTKKITPSRGNVFQNLGSGGEADKTLEKRFERVSKQLCCEGTDIVATRVLPLRNYETPLCGNGKTNVFESRSAPSRYFLLHIFLETDFRIIFFIRFFYVVF